MMDFIFTAIGKYAIAGVGANVKNANDYRNADMSHHKITDSKETTQDMTPINLYLVIFMSLAMLFMIGTKIYTSIRKSAQRDLQHRLEAGYRAPS